MIHATRTNDAIVGQVGAREAGTHHKIQIPKQDLFEIVAFTGIRTPLFLISPWTIAH